MTVDSCSCHYLGSVRDGGSDAGQQEQSGGGVTDPGSLTQSVSLSLPIHVSDTATNSQDGSIFRMQGSEGCDYNKGSE